LKQSAARDDHNLCPFAANHGKDSAMPSLCLLCEWLTLPLP
jgi:hypothetical protein